MCYSILTPPNTMNTKPLQTPHHMSNIIHNIAKWWSVFQKRWDSMSNIDVVPNNSSIRCIILVWQCLALCSFRELSPNILDCCTVPKGMNSGLHFPCTNRAYIIIKHLSSSQIHHSREDLVARSPGKKFYFVWEPKLPYGSPDIFCSTLRRCSTPISIS